MKRKLLLSLLICLIIFVSAAAVAIAATGTQQITALLNGNIKITLHGQPWTPRDVYGNALTPITYNGSTYLPVRAVAEAAGMGVEWDGATQTVKLGSEYDVILEFPADKYPSTAAHIASAILAGESAICTIDRSGANERREQSLAGIPTKDGYDRDEWPMAMCAEGGSGASVAYIDPSDNRGAGSWVGNNLERYPDGTRVKFIVTFGEMDADAKRDQKPGAAGDSAVYYRSCAVAREAGVTPLYKGDPGYGPHLDRDGDGVACE